MARGRHRQRRALLSYRSRERVLLGSLLAAMVVGHLFIVTLTVQSLCAQPLRSDRSTPSSATATSDARPGASSTPAPLGAPPAR
ncbi:hypothetical protein V3N99_02630 [Dermatophilaceae bacterium Soc4.6]